ncbi:uncharacterized protein K460DRAFT_302281, partial [Cucurbitaria berberidis CBS 394.84]
MTDHMQNPMSSQIFQETASTWLEATAARRTSKYVDQVTVTTYSSSSSGSGLSTPPCNESRRSTQTETDWSLNSGSHSAETKKSKELIQALEGKNVENRALLAELVRMEKKVQEQDEHYRVLEERYGAQRAQRVKDKETVDDAFAQYQALETCCDALEEKHDNMKAQCDQMDQEHQAQLQTKDRQLSKLENNHERAVAVLEDTHQKQLASREAEIDEAKALFQKKDEEMDQAGTEQRKLTKAAKINRDAWSEEKTSMKHRITQMNHDYRDSLQAQKDEIERLTNCKRRLEIENALMSKANQRHPPDMEQVQEAIAESQSARKELETARTRYMVIAEKNENILETMQQERDHWQLQLKKEKDAQIQAYELQQQVIELEDRLGFRNDLIRDLGEQIEVLKRSQVLDQQHLDGPTSGFDASYKAASDNDALRDQIKSILNEQAELQRELAKFDTENLSLSMKIEYAEEQLHASEKENKDLKHAHATMIKEIKFLRNAIKRDGNLTVDDKANLGQHLCELTEQNQALTEEVSGLADDLKAAREYNKAVHDKADSEIQKAQKATDFYYTAYYDEAVSKVERLLEEVRSLNMELGRDVHVQERVERNKVVADRAALRYACDLTMRGVDTAMIPAEYYEPGFRPGWIPATYDALRVLRPLGWIPVHELEKVYLAPMYKPFTEEDVAYRLEAQEQTERK